MNVPCPVSQGPGVEPGSSLSLIAVGDLNENYNTVFAVKERRRGGGQGGTHVGPWEILPMMEKGRRGEEKHQCYGDGEVEDEGA